MPVVATAKKNSPSNRASRLHTAWYLPSSLITTPACGRHARSDQRKSDIAFSDADLKAHPSKRCTDEPRGARGTGAHEAAHRVRAVVRGGRPDPRGAALRPRASWMTKAPADPAGHSVPTLLPELVPSSGCRVMPQSRSLPTRQVPFPEPTPLSPGPDPSREMPTWGNSGVRIPVRTPRRLLGS